MPNDDLLTPIQEISRYFLPHYQDVMRPVLDEAGMQGDDWFRLFVAYGLEPEPISATLVHSMFPYGSIENHKQGLAATANKGLLAAVGEDTYRLTEQGRYGITRFYKVTGNALAKAEPLPAAEMNRLADLLQRVIGWTESAPEPAAKPGFQLSRRTDPGSDATASVRIDQYVTDLLRYRDDAHIAAWSPHKISGHAWEAFTYIWRGDAHTPASLSEQLQYRGYTETDYTEALRDLVQRGWLTETDGEYLVTEIGRQLREEADALTDRHFYVGWSALNEDESAEMKRLLARLSNRLQDMIVEDRADLIQHIEKVSQAIYAVAHSTLEAIYTDADIAERGLPFTLLFARAIEPEPISGETISAQFPYSTPSSWQDHMKKLAKKGLLAGNGGSTYHLTDNGRNLWSHVRKNFDDRLRDTESALAGVFSAAELDRLAALLGRIVDACLAASEPPGARCIKRSHGLAPDANAPTLAKIDQCIDDLNAFRDDAHLASFKKHEISGHAWEFFTFLWRGEATTAAEMSDKAQPRGHSAEAYTEALGDLVKRGWVEATSGGIHTLTQIGREIREEAEALTNRYYFTPWAALSSGESQELRDLLARLEASLKQIEQSAPVPA